MSDILIAGFGFVGQAVEKLFPGADVYDPNCHRITGTFNIDQVFRHPPKRKYRFVMVCVPTPSNPDGSCDISAVEDVVSKIDADVFIIRSTIPPGTTDAIEMQYRKNLVFQPEYVASSSPYPAPLADIRKHPFVILGGRYEVTKKIRRLYESVYPPTTRIFEVDSRTAECIKYLENAFIATKVSFCNEAYRICEAFGVDYDQVREGVFGCDPRMTEWWTYCQGKGWGGHCLPKDMNAIIKACEDSGYDAKFLKAVREINEIHKSSKQDKEEK